MVTTGGVVGINGGGHFRRISQDLGSSSCRLGATVAMEVGSGGVVVEAWKKCGKDRVVEGFAHARQCL